MCLLPTCSTGATAFWQECSGPGACTTQKQDACGSFGCAGGVCASACTVSGDCAATGYCNKGSCAAKLPNGGVCGLSEECQSNLCVDGVCCNAACAGQCEACAEPGSEGTCVPVTGEPRGTKAACDAALSPDAPCSARRCDGIVRDSCVGYALPTEVCSKPGCVGGQQTFEAKCDGKGSCDAIQTKQCAPYVCGGSACMSDCASGDDCAPGASCNAGKCVQGATCDGSHTVTGADGKSQSCAPYRCNADGTCKVECNSLEDCVGGNLCNQDQRCVQAGADDTGDDGGCGCRVPGGPLPFGPGALALFAFGALMWRRRVASAPTDRLVAVGSGSRGRLHRCLQDRQ